MDVMLTQGAVEMFTVAPDNFFSKNTNHWHVDWEAPVNLKRRYLTDDLDTVLHYDRTTWDIYGADQNQGPSDVQTIILGHPTFRPRFEEAMCKLLAGPFQAAALIQMVTDVETAIGVELQADPNNNILFNDVPLHFDTMRLWMTARIADVESQVTCSIAPAVPATSNWGQAALAVLLFVTACTLIVSGRRQGANLYS